MELPLNYLLFHEHIQASGQKYEQIQNLMDLSKYSKVCGSTSDTSLKSITYTYSSPLFRLLVYLMFNLNLVDFK